MYTDDFLSTVTWNCLQHGGGRARHSDLSENSFITVIYEKMFFKFGQNFLSKARLKMFSYKQPL